MIYQGLPFDFTRVSEDERIKQLSWCLSELGTEQLVILNDPQSRSLIPALEHVARQADTPYAVLEAPALGFRLLDDPLANPPSSPAIPRLHAKPREAIILADYDSSTAKLAQQITNKIDAEVRGIGWIDAPDSLGLYRYARGVVDYPTFFAELQRAKVVIIPPAATGQLVAPAQLAMDAISAGVPVISFTNNGVDEHFSGSEVRFAANVNEAILEAGAVIAEGDGQRLSNASNRISTNHLATNWWTQQVAQLAAPTPATTASVRVTKEGPRVSFVSAAYKIPDFVGPMIESCLNQTVQDVEVVVTHDGSPDETRSVIEKYLGDPRVRLVDQANIGQTGRIDWVFERSTRETQGDFIAVIGGDDVNFPDRVERQLEIFDGDPRVDLVHSGGIQLDRQGNSLQKLFFVDRSYSTATFFGRHVLANAIASPSVMVKRESFKRFGAWSEGFPHDYKLNIDLARGGVIRYSPHALFGYRIHGNNISVGDGAQRGIDEGRRLRDFELPRTSLADMHPALQDVEPNDTQSLAKVLRELGTGHLMALKNDDVAHAFLTRVNALHPELLENLDLSQGPPFADLPQPDNAIAWDGTPANQKRILCLVDWNRPQLAANAISAYLKTFNKADNIDLVLTTNGRSPDEVLGSLPQALPPGFDIENGPQITLERWDDPDFLPLGRFAEIFNLWSQPNLEEPTAMRRLQPVNQALQAMAAASRTL